MRHLCAKIAPAYVRAAAHVSKAEENLPRGYGNAKSPSPLREPRSRSSWGRWLILFTFNHFMSSAYLSFIWDLSHPYYFDVSVYF